MSELPWWKRTCVYQIYPRSFFDADGDGIGDLQGVIAKLDYLRWLGVETLWLSPFYQSPQADFGYDISDHYSIAKEYGDIADAERLIDEVHARGMKLVLDMVMNHTSNQHPWFLASKSGRDSPMRDYYIWRDGRKPGGKAPPNNWKSMLGGTGWHYDDSSGQWVWASFLPFQPDLNYRNPAVKKAMLDVVRHWLSRGVDGLRLDIFNAIFKDASFADNPFSWRPIPSENNPHGFFQHNLHTIDHADTLAFARELRAVVDEYSNPPRFLVGEVFGDARTLRRYCGDDADGLHLVFLFQSLGTRFTGSAVRALIEEFERSFPEPYSPTYVFGNHDRPRSIHKLGLDQDKAKLLATLQLTVRGVPFVYYGEEIGMRHHEIPLHEGLDPIAARYRFMPQPLVRFMRGHGILLNRDECRLPMQWDASVNAGFTPPQAKPWLPVHPESADTNVAAQSANATSLLSCYRALLGLRRGHPVLQAGALSILREPGTPGSLLSYQRKGDGPERARIHLNFDKRPAMLRTAPGADARMFSNLEGATITAPARYILRPYEGVVVFERG